jgi:aspartate/methionine/tyrosine aminotransferase
MIERSYKHYSVKPGTIYLRGGDPNFATPAHIRDAAIKAIIEGYTHYAPSEGIPELRDSIANYYSKYGVKYDPDQIMVTSGGSPALHMINVSMLEPGDEVLVFDPSFSRYFSEPPTLGAVVKPVPLLNPGFHLDPEDLKANINEKSKMIVLCNPNNPTGTVYSKSELKAIADIAIDNDLIVVSDEFYSEFTYDDKKHVAISSLDGMSERTFVLVGGTKMFNFTGWRLASLILPKAYYKLVEKKTRFIGVRPATFVQRAGAEAFNAMSTKYGKEVMKAHREEYDRRRNFFCKRMDEIDGINCHTFEGAFYAYPDVSSFGLPVSSFIDELEREEGVLVGNGEGHGGVSVIGEKSPAFGHIRPALVQDVDVLEEAAAKIERFTKEIPK